MPLGKTIEYSYVGIIESSCYCIHTSLEIIIIIIVIFVFIITLCNKLWFSPNNQKKVRLIYKYNSHPEIEMAFIGFIFFPSLNIVLNKWNLTQSGNWKQKFRVTWGCYKSTQEWTDWRISTCAHRSGFLWGTRIR